MKAGRFTATLVCVTWALVLSGCASTPTTDATAASEAYCASSKAVLSELATLKDMVSSGGSTRNEISDQGQVVMDAALTAYRNSNNLSDSTRSEVQAADQAFRDAILAIPSTTSTVAEATQAYQAAMDTYNASIDAVRAAQNC